MSATASIGKCVIMARGLGTRMRKGDASAGLDATQAAAAESGVKAMIPVGRPFLDYVLSALADAAFREVCLIIGPEHQSIRDYYGSEQVFKRIAVRFAVQEKPIGTANAVLAAEEFVCGDEFLVMNSDNYYPLEVLRQLQQLGQPGTVLFEAAGLIQNSNIPEERLRAFASCVVDADGFLADINEKPAAADANFDGGKLVSMNIWRFGTEIFQACRDVPLSARGEYELPQAVRLGLQRGMKLKVDISRAGVLDLSRRTDIAAVTEYLKNVQVAL
jgi:dTDP-glucose pyrophosphorylase